MGDLVVVTVVATRTRWVDLKVAAWSRSGSLTGWFDLGVGCTHGRQIGSGVGCSWRSDWLRGGSFTGHGLTMVWSIFRWLPWERGMDWWRTRTRDGLVRMRDGSTEYPLLARLEGWVFFLWVWVQRGCVSSGVCLFVFLDHFLYSLFLLFLSLSSRVSWVRISFKGKRKA